MADDSGSSSTAYAELNDLPPPVIDTWSVAVALVGISLWAQCFWTPLAARLQAGAAEPWRILPLVVPLGAVGASLVWRTAWLRLFVVPVSLVPGLLMVPGAEVAASGPLSLLRIAATLAVYLVFAGLGLRRDQQFMEWEALQGSDSSSDEWQVSTPNTDELERPAGLYPYFVRTRLVWMVGLFVALMWGVHGSAQTAQLMAEHFPDHPAEATMFLTVLVTFVWCVAVYVGALRPVANVEYRLRKRNRTLENRPDAQAAGRRLAWRVVFGAAGIAGVAVFAM
jgi:hypothetical protein